MAVLTLKNVTKFFGLGSTNIKAVDGVNLEINKGEVVLIMGPSGSGKTTLLSLAGCLLKPTSGLITIDSQDIIQLTDNQLAELRLKYLGFIFQGFNLFPALTAQENVQLIYNLAGKKGSEVADKSKKLLDQLGLGKRFHHKPKELSGGEQQRVAIARAMALNPKLILADEPTGNLDSKTGHEVMSLLCNNVCKEGRSILIVSHDQRIKDIAHKIYWMEDGRIIKEEKGGHEKTCSHHNH